MVAGKRWLQREARRRPQARSSKIPKTLLRKYTQEQRIGGFGLDKLVKPMREAGVFQARNRYAVSVLKARTDKRFNAFLVSVDIFGDFEEGVIREPINHAIDKGYKYVLFVTETATVAEVEAALAPVYEE